jgi:hypothetical protein
MGPRTGDFLPVREVPFRLYVLDLGQGITRFETTSADPPAIHPKEITSSPWLPLWQGSTFSLSRKAFPLRAEEPTIYLMITENTLFLRKFSEATEVILDTVLTGIPELNHFWGHWEEGENEDPGTHPSCGVKGPGHEIRLFGQPAAVIEEQLKRAGQRLALPFSKDSP